MKKLLTHLPKAMLLLFVMLVFVQVNAQKRYAPLASSDFVYTIENDYQVSTTKLRFDLYIKDTDPSSPFELSQIQAGVLFNKSISTGTFTATIVASSSQLVAAMVPTAISINSGSGVTADRWCVQLASKVPPPCGGGTFISSVGLGTRVCTIELTSSVAFTNGTFADLLFNYTISPYPTKVFMRQNCVGVELTCTSTNSIRGISWQNLPLANPMTTFNVLKVYPLTNQCNSATIGVDGTTQTTVTYTLYKDGAPMTPEKVGTGTANTGRTWWPGQTGSNEGTSYRVLARLTATPTIKKWMDGERFITNTPEITFDALAPVCEGSAPVLLSALPEWGVFTGEGVVHSNNTMRDSFDPSAVAPDSFFDIFYDISINGCAASQATQQIFVEALPVITFEAPTTDFCVGQTYTLYAEPVGGTFSGVGVIGDQFTPTAPGTVDITYNYSSPMGCMAVPVTNPFNCIVCITTPTWTGLVDDEWTNPGNWIPGVPLPTDDVIIPGGCPNYPSLDAGVTYMVNNLDINGGGVKAPLAGSFTIYGELVVGGNLTISSTGALIIGGGGALTVEGDLTISGSMTVQTNGSLITNGTVTGEASVERYIAADWSWHILSSPVNQQYICNGAFAPLPGNFPGTLTPDWDFYKWWANCPIPPAQNWRNLRGTDGLLNTIDWGANPGFQPTRGYLVSYGPTSTLPTTKVFQGAPGNGDKVASFFDIFTECTWDLPGNPFPSALDWNLVTGKENLYSGYYYVWNENKLGGAGYEFSDGLIHSSAAIDGFIPSMQGFFVKLLPNGGPTQQLGFPNSARAHHFATSWLKDDQANRLTIALGNGTNYDEAFVMFMDGVNAGKDRKDAEKLFSMRTGIPQVYTIVDNDQKTALNAMSYVTNGTTIPVGIIAPADGEYSIKVSGIENFSSLTGLSLEDKALNYTQNLLQNPVYTFTATGNEDAGRFLLHFAGPIGIGEKNNSLVNIFSSEKSVFVTCAAGFKNATVTISNLLGQEIVSQKLNDQPMNEIKVNALKGYYVVKVQNESSLKTAKVYIN